MNFFFQLSIYYCVRIIVTETDEFDFAKVDRELLSRQISTLVLVRVTA